MSSAGCVTVHPYGVRSCEVWVKSSTASLRSRGTGFTVTLPTRHGLGVGLNLLHIFEHEICGHPLHGFDKHLRVRLPVGVTKGMYHMALDLIFVFWAEVSRGVADIGRRLALDMLPELVGFMAGYVAHSRTPWFYRLSGPDRVLQMSKIGYGGMIAQIKRTCQVVNGNVVLLSSEPIYPLG